MRWAGSISGLFFDSIFLCLQSLLIYMTKHLVSLVTSFTVSLLILAGCNAADNRLIGKWEEMESLMPFNSEFEFYEGGRFQYKSSYVQDTSSKEKYTVYKGTYNVKADTLFTYTEENPDKLLFAQPYEFQEGDKLALGSVVFKKIK